MYFSEFTAQPVRWAGRTIIPPKRYLPQRFGMPYRDKWTIGQSGWAVLAKLSFLPFTNTITYTSQKPAKANTGRCNYCKSTTTFLYDKQKP